LGQGWGSLMSNHDSWWEENQRLDLTPRQDGGYPSPASDNSDELMQAIEAEYEAEYEDEFGS